MVVYIPYKTTGLEIDWSSTSTITNQLEYFDEENNAMKEINKQLKDLPTNSKKRILTYLLDLHS